MRRPLALTRTSRAPARPRVSPVVTYAGVACIQTIKDSSCACAGR